MVKSLRRAFDGKHRSRSYEKSHDDNLERIERTKRDCKLTMSYTIRILRRLCLQTSIFSFVHSLRFDANVTV